MAEGGVPEDSDYSLSEDEELESTRVGDMQVTMRSVKHKKRKVDDDLSWLSTYKGDERYQCEFDVRIAREEEELYWENVRLDKKSMQDQYAALNEELSSLVKQRDDFISENRKNKEVLQEEAERLKQDNRYMKRKVQEECHEFQRLQVKLVQAKKANESSLALGATYEKELKKFSREWHTLKKRIWFRERIDL